MNKEFQQVQWDAVLEDDCRQLVRLAVREDLDRRFDVTTVSLVDREAVGTAVVMARQSGVICGLRAGRLALDEMEITSVQWQAARRRRGFGRCRHRSGNTLRFGS